MLSWTSVKQGKLSWGLANVILRTCHCSPETWFVISRVGGDFSWGFCHRRDVLRDFPVFRSREAETCSHRELDRHWPLTPDWCRWSNKVVFGPQTPVTFLIHHDVRKSFKDERGRIQVEIFMPLAKCATSCCPCSRANSRWCQQKKKRLLPRYQLCFLEIFYNAVLEDYCVVCLLP